MCGDRLDSLTEDHRDKFRGHYCLVRIGVLSHILGGVLKYTGLRQTLILCARYNVSPFKEKERDCGKRKEFFGEY